jgi:DNA-binding IclR family transcriptional regulator
VDRPPKERPAYAITSVDHALRLATMLQLEGSLSVTQAAERLGVAASTAHRLLAMLVYRDFATPTEQRTYRAGPVLELAAHAQSGISRLRTLASPLMAQLVDRVGESTNLIIRTGDTARFIASVECEQILRVGSREGMAFLAHRVTGGLVLLAELDRHELNALYSADRFIDRMDQRPDLDRLARDLRKIRSAGFALNQGLAERGVTALGVAVRDSDGHAIAGLSVSMPSVRFETSRIPMWIAALSSTAAQIASALDE